MKEVSLDKWVNIFRTCSLKFVRLSVGAFLKYRHHINIGCVSFPAGALSNRGRSGSERLKCVLREALVWRGSDGLHLKIAPVNTPVTLWICVCVCVCVSFTWASLHNRKIRCTCVYLCASSQTGVCILVHTSIPGWSEPCALVSLYPAVTGAPFQQLPITGQDSVMSQWSTQILAQVLTATHAHIHGIYSSHNFGWSCQLMYF